MVFEILSNEQMQNLDRGTIEAGTPGYTLMCRAGEKAAEEIIKTVFGDKAVVLCGPGNNGGDGFVIARHLKEAGWDVRLACLLSPENLKGDARKAYEDWQGETRLFKDIETDPDDLIIDAVFGTGFSKALSGDVARLFDRLKDQNNLVVAVDIPSGVNGNTGEVDPHTLKARLTITFHRKKLGHMLMPGMAYSGECRVKDIGIAQDDQFTAMENTPYLWEDELPHQGQESHKYKRGHAVIYGAPELAGATRLAAESCSRIGAGLVSVLCNEQTSLIYKSSLPAHILVRDDLNWWDDRITAQLYGSGGLPREIDLKDIPTVLDAEALLCLPRNLNEKCVLTPHEGEFAKAFPSLKGSKLEKAKAAAEQTGAIIVLKGADTIIAHPDGRIVMNNHASASLATAGTGDVLAGLVAGLLAQGMEPFWASCAAVWIHGEAGLKIGPGLVASDLQKEIPEILNDLSLNFSP